MTAPIVPNIPPLPIKIDDRAPRPAIQIPSPVPVEFAGKSAPKAIQKADAFKSAKEETLRLVCSTCNKIVSGPKGEADYVAYIQCIPCFEAEKRAERASVVDRLVTCEKCGRKVIARLDEHDKATTVQKCSRCSSAHAQSEEGTTFAPKGRVLRNGKRVGYAESGGPRSMGAQDYLQYQGVQEAENKVRREISSRLFVEDAQKEIKEVSIRQIQEQFGITYESARQGKIRLLRLKVERETLPQAPPTPKSVKRKPRKCPHGVWKHRDDRQKSRHCSVCYPNIHANLVNWKTGEHDAEIRALYLAGQGGKQAIKNLAQKFRMSQRKIREALDRAGIAIESDSRESKKPKKYVAKKDSAARLARSDQHEDFGLAPLDPQIAVTN